MRLECCSVALIGNMSRIIDPYWHWKLKVLVFQETCEPAFLTPFFLSAILQFVFYLIMQGKIICNALAKITKIWIRMEIILSHPAMATSIKCHGRAIYTKMTKSLRLCLIIVSIWNHGHPLSFSRSAVKFRLCYK